MAKPAITDEKDLLQQLRDGDHTAFQSVYNHYWPVMYSHALRMLGDAAEAQDITQELFITFHQRIPKLADGTNIANYLYIILRNKIINLIRDQKVRRGHLASLVSFAEHASNDTLAQIEEKELSQIIDDEIGRMPPRMREIFEMSRKEYLSHKEIAERLDLSDKTVKTQVNNALKILRTKIGLFVFIVSCL